MHKKQTHHSRKRTFIRLSNGNIHYAAYGNPDHPTIIFVHGAFMPMWAWDFQIETLVEQGFHVVQYDHYGRGYSDHPRIDFNRDLYLDQLRELIDVLNIDQPFYLAGNSFGGSVVVRYTVRYPDKVKKLILADPFIYPDVNNKVLKIIKLPVFGKIMITLFGRLITRNRFNHFFSTVSRSTETYQAMIYDQIAQKGFIQSLYSFVTSNALSDYRHEYAKLGRENIPVLLVWGKEDRVINKAMIDDVKTYVSHCKYVEIDGCGHAPYFEKPDDFNRVIIPFLRN